MDFSAGPSAGGSRWKRVWQLACGVRGTFAEKSKVARRARHLQSPFRHRAVCSPLRKERDQGALGIPQPRDAPPRNRIRAWFGVERLPTKTLFRPRGLPLLPGLSRGEGRCGRPCRQNGPAQAPALHGSIQRPSGVFERQDSLVSGQVFRTPDACHPSVPVFQLVRAAEISEARQSTLCVRISTNGTRPGHHLDGLRQRLASSNPGSSRTQGRRGVCRCARPCRR